MTPFAFIIHPLSAHDLARKLPIARYFPTSWCEAILKQMKPMKVSEITGIQSITGDKAQGWFVGCPLTPRQLTETLPVEFVYERLLQACEIAHGLGAKVVGLGAFTAVAGDAGITLSKRAPLAVTTGNSYTVATAIEGTLKAADLLDIDRARATLAVVGATGSIGKTCARVLARDFGQTVLVGRDLPRTQAVAEDIPGALATTDVAAIREADVIVSVTSTDSAIILPEHLKPGALVCDVSRPRDVSARVAKERPDVLVIEGGVVKVPGENVQFNWDFGFPPHTAYACMCETIMLALENRAESFTLGKDVSVAQVEETQGWAKKHGFELAGFRSFERAVDQSAIERARSARRTPAAAR